jgi:Fe-S cluster assembly protein SufB
MEKDQDKILSDVTTGEYKYGFYSDIEMDRIPKGLSEEVVRLISSKKNEPDWLLEFRLKSYRHWLTMKMPTWPNLKIAPINYQDIIFYAAPKERKNLNSVDDIDPELKKTFDKLGIPLEEQKHLAGVAVDAVIDSVSVKTTLRKHLLKWELSSVHSVMP